MFTFQGKFVFKNGRIYEGMFECDHIVEFPDFQMDGLNTPDLTQIRTRTPLPSGTVFFVTCNAILRLLFETVGLGLLSPDFYSKSIFR